jgi:hypothetical protein
VAKRVIRSITQKKKGQTRAKRRRKDNTVAKRRRTDNTVAKRVIRSSNSKLLLITLLATVLSVLL